MRWMYCWPPPPRARRTATSAVPFRPAPTGQDHGGGDVGVLQQLQRHKLVVLARLRVLQNGLQLPEVRWPQEVRNVDHGRFCQQRQRLRLHLQHPAAAAVVVAGSGELAASASPPQHPGSQQHVRQIRSTAISTIITVSISTSRNNHSKRTAGSSCTLVMWAGR